MRKHTQGKRSKDKRDIYYRLAKEEGYRARSAYKLAQIDTYFNLLDSCNTVVDLCAAPGSWSQYVARARPEVRVVAIDLQRMEPISGVQTIKADITCASMPDTIRDALGASADIVLTDGAPDVTGAHDFDSYVQGHLVLAALGVARQVLRPGGAFVAKVFRTRDVDLLYAQLDAMFDTVVCAKPRASRATSVEAFVVCRGFRPCDAETPMLLDGVPSGGTSATCTALGRRVVVPFISCGGEDTPDSTMSYSLDSSKHVPLPPVVAPTEPPYAEALARTSGGGGASDTSGGHNSVASAPTPPVR